MGLLLTLGHMACSFQQLVIPMKNFDLEESTIPDKSLFFSDR